MEASSQKEAIVRTESPKVHPEMARKTPRKKLIVGTVVAVAGILLLGGGFKWWQHISSIEETDDATIAGHVHQLSSRVSGTVTKMLVDDNQHVKEGQLLLEIDPKDFQLSVDAARASEAEAVFKTQEIESNIVANERQAEAREFEAQSAVASAKAGVDKARSVLSETRLGVSLARTEIRQRQAELTRAVADFERYKSLVEDRATTMQSYDKAKQDKDVAEANLQAAQEAYKQSQMRVQQAQQAVADAESEVTRAKAAASNAQAAHAQTETSKKNLSVQEAAVAKARSDYENAMSQLSYTKIMAPITGRIGHRTVEIGQQIERGQALMSVVSDEKWVVANFKETQLNRMRPGQKVDI
ncbi:MAG: HlyD family secretion protein, partial [Candidatus Obscuribacterales bacterium]|nr:HlyD family secretion protein [Candidatus Obscuribacterales bacterium]